MTEQPLSQRMREAAETLKAVYDQYPQYGVRWTPALLLNEAHHVEAEENDAAEREAWVEELARETFSLLSPLRSHQTWGDVSESIRDKYRAAAQGLIDNGWTKS